MGPSLVSNVEQLYAVLTVQPPQATHESRHLLGRLSQSVEHHLAHGARALGVWQARRRIKLRQCVGRQVGASGDERVRGDRVRPLSDLHGHRQWHTDGSETTGG